jgi:hypothetical protein
MDSIYDYVHVPFMLKNEYVDLLNLENINYYTYTRNPYHRIISAFFYKNQKCIIKDFKLFVKNKLIKYDFNTKFDKRIIHYYPQHLFICDKSFQIDEVKYYKLENTDFNIKKYNLQEYFDVETLKIINDIYKKDFEFITIV